MAANYQAQQAGQKPPAIECYDSTTLTSMDDFYRKAKPTGVQLVVGPLEKPLVKQLSTRPQLPITTLALNYSDSGTQGPAELFQFGLAAEDEAREVARRAWADGIRRAVPWCRKANGVIACWRPSARSWQAKGGTLLGLNASISRSHSLSRSPICSSCATAKAAPSACKAPLARSGRSAFPSPGRRLHVPGCNTSTGAADQADPGLPVRWRCSGLRHFALVHRQRRPEPVQRPERHALLRNPLAAGTPTTRCANKSPLSGHKLPAAWAACMPWASTRTVWRHD